MQRFCDFFVQKAVLVIFDIFVETSNIFMLLLWDFKSSFSLLFWVLNVVSRDKSWFVERVNENAMYN
jgi:hypothetical protein